MKAFVVLLAALVVFLFMDNRIKQERINHVDLGIQAQIDKLTAERSELLVEVAKLKEAAAARPVEPAPSKDAQSKAAPVIAEKKESWLDKRLQDPRRLEFGAYNRSNPTVTSTTYTSSTSYWVDAQGVRHYYSAP